MGEYMRRRSDGERIKVGTCEDLFYLRYDQLDAVAVDGDADPRRALEVYRFRFPWPNEDDVAPGDFGDYSRELGLYGVSAPAELEHGLRQFTTDGYVVSLPCPEAGEVPGYRVGRNGNPGPVRITGQAVRYGRLVLIAKCGGCGTASNVPPGEEAPYLEELRRKADYLDHEKAIGPWADDANHSSGATFYRLIAERIEAGYALEVDTTAPAARPLTGQAAHARRFRGVS